MPTLEEIQTAVQRQFGDDTEAQITRDDITRWANEGQLAIARKTDVLLEPFTAPTVIGQADTPLPVDFLRIERVTLDGVIIHKTSSAYLDAENPSRGISPVVTGRPTRFYVKRKALSLYPIPDSVYTLGGEIITRPEILADPGDTPQVPVELHADIVRYCLSRAYELDGQRVEAREVMGEFTENLGWAVDEAGNPYTDSYPLIREV